MSVMSYMISYKCIAFILTIKVYINVIYTKTELSLMPSIHFQYNHSTGLDTFVSMTTKRINLLMTKHVLNVISQ